MIVSVLVFGVLKSAVGASRIDIDAATAGEVHSRALQRCGFSGLSGTQLWVNGDVVDDDYDIDPRDEVALLPPFSGG